MINKYTKDNYSDTWLPGDYIKFIVSQLLIIYIITVNITIAAARSSSYSFVVIMFQPCKCHI